MRNLKRSSVLGLAALAAIALAGTAFLVAGGGTRVLAQAYGGASNVEVGGRGIGGSQAPSVSDTTPTVSGSVAPGTSVTVQITPGDVTLTTTAGADGKFQVQVNSTLAPGTYNVAVNGTVVGSFTVGQAPLPPATGSGSSSSGGGFAQLLLLIIAGAALLVAGVRGVASIRTR